MQHSIRDRPDEDLTSRVIEIPESSERLELRDPKSGFVAYAPPRSPAKASFWLPAVAMVGRRLIFHGLALNGLGEVPGLAGQSPANIARQLYLMATGAHAGARTPSMRGVVEKLTNDDVGRDLRIPRLA